MKRESLSIILMLFLTSLFAQQKEAYNFNKPYQLACTPIKSQDQTGTCWSFSTASFLESEALRMGKGEHDLSEMFVVRNIYHQKCENYVRRQGHAQFGEGGLAHDLLNAVKRYGIMPESAYPGRKDASKPLNHQKLVKSLEAACNDFVKQAGEGKLSDKWMTKIDSMLDAEFGVVPTQFTYNNTLFTPISFKEFLGIDPDDYVSITSFSHHPFYESFILEVPDNFANGSFYNVPLGDMMRTLSNSIQHGYTVEWDADVSNNGFSAQNGIAIVPERDWKDKDVAAQNNTFKVWEREKNVTQEYRQQLFDRQVTTDDHLMHIVGVLNEGHGGDYYVVKNSWGEISDLKGFVYVSDPYMRQNTISFTVHKNALPKDIRQRIGLAPEGNPFRTPAEAKEKRASESTTPASQSGTTKPKLDRNAVHKMRDEKKSGSSSDQ